MRPVLSILIYTNCWVAACVSSLVFGISSYYHIQDSWLYGIWSFTGTVSAYQAHRLIRLRQLQYTVRSNRRLLWMQNTYSFQWLWLILNSLAFGALSLLIPLTNSTILLIILNAVIVGLYVIPLPFLKNGIRSLPFAKNILISLSWTCIVAVPFTSGNLPIDWRIPVLIFIAVFAQIVPFDARDKDYDDQRMRTIPQLIGTTASMYVGFGLLLLALVLQTSLIGFHLILPFIIFCAGIGHLIPFKVGYQLRLEFMWELPLGLMGLWFWLS
jgi:hypothetical protein